MAFRSVGAAIQRILSLTTRKAGEVIKAGQSLEGFSDAA